LIAALACVAPALAAPPKLPTGVDPENTILITTTKGRIVIKLRTDLAPKHAERIKTLAREKFYDGVPFHRVIEGFMAQTGDGQYFNGTGVRNIPTCRPSSHHVPFKRIVGWRAGRATTIPPTASSSSCSRRPPASAASTPWW
jgi:peptidylprolyl isomerase